ncbi:MAG TPA: HD-GYP domain-containing protein, partial [Candidatus Omnitrophota bacterium]|nr:HD-GYP domain-containing protein [Candidatus Omnitrophota bacterium]
LKILVNHIGIYPIGSWVELNTDEKGKVIAASDEFPLRPVIKLFFDNLGNRLVEPKVINLSKQANIFIKRPVCDKDVCGFSKECK